LRAYNKSISFRPALLSRFLGNLLASFGREFLGSGASALRAAELAKRDRSRIPAILNAVISLPRGDVSYELGEGNRIARAFLAGFGHYDIVAWLATGCSAPSTPVEFKLNPLPSLCAFFTRRRGSGMTRKGWYIEELAGLAIVDCRGTAFVVVRGGPLDAMNVIGRRR